MDNQQSQIPRHTSHTRWRPVSPVCCNRVLACDLDVDREASICELFEGHHMPLAA